MDIDVDGRRIHLDIQEIGGDGRFGNEFLKGLFHGVVKVWMADIPAIAKEILFAPRFPCCFRFTDISNHGYKFRFGFYGEEFLVDLVAKKMDDPLPEIPFGELENRLIIVKQGKFDIRVYQSHPLKFFEYMPEFHVVRFQEITPGGYVIE
jgi:hypothetical protein